MVLQTWRNEKALLYRFLAESCPKPTPSAKLRQDVLAHRQVKPMFLLAFGRPYAEQVWDRLRVWNMFLVISRFQFFSRESYFAKFPATRNTKGEKTRKHKAPSHVFLRPGRGLEKTAKRLRNQLLSDFLYRDLSGFNSLGFPLPGWTLHLKQMHRAESGPNDAMP